MLTALVVFSLVVGYGLGKLDAIWRLHRLMLNLTPEQQKELKALIRA